MEIHRPTWEEFFLNIAKVTATRSSCIRRSVGSVIVKNNHIISTGYNGTPKGITNCNEGGCKRCNDYSIKTGEKLDHCICLHAEENAILHANISLEDCDLYCTHRPCIGCMKRIIQVGIKRIYYIEDYNFPDELQKINNSFGYNFKNIQSKVLNYFIYYKMD